MEDVLFFDIYNIPVKKGDHIHHISTDTYGIIDEVVIYSSYKTIYYDDQYGNRKYAYIGIKPVVNNDMLYDGEPRSPIEHL